MNGLSIRWRLTLWYVAALSVILMAFGAVMFAMYRSHVLTLLDAELIEEARGLTVEIEFAHSEEEFRERIEQHYADRDNFSFQINRLDGTVLFGSRWLLAHELPRPQSVDAQKQGQIVNYELPYSGRHRLYQRTVRGPTGPLLVNAITSLSRSDREVWAFLLMIMAGGALALLVAVSGGFLIAHHAMQPILRITSTAERISSQNLSERVPIINRFDELGRLSMTLNETFDRLQATIDQMRQFTADAAHELRTPLAVIRTEAEVSLRGRSTLEGFRRVAEVAVDQSTRLSQLVDQLLTLSRQDAGLQLDRHEDVALKAILLDVIDMLRITAEQKRVELVTGRIANACVLGDDVALSQLFFNLLDNALKFTPSGGTVNISGSVDNDFAIIRIEDTGIGIENRDLSHIFKRFFRVDSSRTDEGTGLGLAICKSIVDAHHGEIHVESDPGVGSCFTVKLPRKESSSAEIEIRQFDAEIRQPASL